MATWVRDLFRIQRGSFALALACIAKCLISDLNPKLSESFAEEANGLSWTSTAGRKQGWTGNGAMPGEKNMRERLQHGVRCGTGQRTMPRVAPKSTGRDAKIRSSWRSSVGSMTNVNDLSSHGSCDGAAPSGISPTPTPAHAAYFLRKVRALNSNRAYFCEITTTVSGHPLFW